MYLSLMATLLMFLLQNGQDFYQQALVQERAAGNLEAAIQLYQDAARYAGNDRNLAAQALLGAARCQEKLGQARARELYEEIVRSFADQPQQVAQARDRARALQPRENRTADEPPDPQSLIDKMLLQVGPGMYWSRLSPLANRFIVGNFDPSKPISITGTVTRLAFENPSISIFIETTASDGKAVTYIVKGGAPNTLVRNGFNKDTIRAGDVVTVDGLSGSEPNSLVIGAATLTFRDGRKISLGQSVSGQ